MFNRIITKLKLKLIHWLEIDKLNSNLISVSKDFNTYKTRNNEDIIYLTEKDEDYFTALKKLIVENKQEICNQNNKYMSKYREMDNKYDSLHRTIQECLKIGADIGRDCGSYNRYDNSWAVVCFKRGNTNIVKFIDLDSCGRNGLEIYQYLRQFDSSRHIIDSPFQYFEKDVLYQWSNDKN